MSGTRVAAALPRSDPPTLGVLRALFKALLRLYNDAALPRSDPRILGVLHAALKAPFKALLRLY